MRSVKYQASSSHLIHSAVTFGKKVPHVLLNLLILGEYNSSHQAHGVLLTLGAGRNTIWKAQRPSEDLELKSFSIHSLLWIMRSDAACGYLCMSSSHICEGYLIHRTTGGERIRALGTSDRKGACFSITHTWNCH